MRRNILVVLAWVACFFAGRYMSAQKPSEVMVRVIERVKPQSIHDEATKATLTYWAAMYVERDSGKPNLGSIRKMVNAAYLTATIFPDFGPRDFAERLAEHLSYGYGETRWTAGNISYNLPGHTPGVSRFSVDCYWPGLNEVHLYGKNNVRKEAVKLQESGVIPSNISLMWFPAKSAFDKAHADYKRQKAAGIRAKKMKFSVKIYEQTQDQITSALIYRIMIEKERREWGMTKMYYGKSNRGAKAFLLKQLRDHNIR